MPTDQEPMRNSILRIATASCAFSLTVLGTAQEPAWLHHFGNSGAVQTFMTAWDGSIHFYGLGLIEGGDPVPFDGLTYTALGHRDIVLVKYDTAGTVKWVHSSGSACFKDDYEITKDIAFDPAGQRVIISGQFNCGTISFGDQVISDTYSLNADKGFIASYDSSGTCLWARGITGFDVRPENVLVDEASKVFLFGNANTTNAYFQGDEPVSVPPGGFVGKYSPDGALLGAERLITDGLIYGGAWFSPDQWALVGDGGPAASLLGVTTGAALPGNDAWVSKVDTNGVVAWITPFLSNTGVTIRYVQVGADGNAIIQGSFRDSLITSLDTLIGPADHATYFLASVNPQGAVLWVRSISSNVLVRITDLELGPDGDIYVYGGFQGDLQLTGTTLTASTTLDSFFARFDPTNGTCKAAYHYGRSNFGFGSLVSTANGLYIAGEYDSTMVIGSYTLEPSGPGAIDLVIAKFDSLSGFTGIQRHADLNEELHIYANPNNGLCTIELPQSLRMTHDLVLSVFDNTGNLVQRIPLTAGSEGIRLDIRAQAKGIYHVELGDGEQRYSGSIVFE